jgi:hypothetical protein
MVHPPLTPEPGKPPEGAGSPGAPDESPAWKVIVTIIAVCFLTGIAFLVLAVWLDWD